MLGSGLSYFADLMNYAQWTMGVLFWIYFNARIKNPGCELFPPLKLSKADKVYHTKGNPKLDGETIHDNNVVFWVALNSILVLMISVYVLFYARVFEKFGLFVRICTDCVMAMSNFLIFLIFWIIVF